MPDYKDFLPHLEISGTGFWDTKVKINGCLVPCTKLAFTMEPDKFNEASLSMLAAPIEFKDNVMIVVSLVDGKQYKFNGVVEIEPMPEEQLAELQSDYFQTYFSPDK